MSFRKEPANERILCPFKQHRFEEHRRKLEALVRPAASVLRVFEHMQRNPIMSIPAAARAEGRDRGSSRCG
jgi:hypothetical protein